MIRFLYGILCESVIVNQQTEQLSIINTIDGFTVNELPGAIDGASLLLTWLREGDLSQEESQKVRIRLKTPDQNSTPQQLEFDQLMPVNKRRLRTIVELKGLVFPLDGDNILVAEVKKGDTWEQVGNVLLEISKKPSPRSTTDMPPA